MFNPFRKAVANLAPGGIPDLQQIGAVFPPAGNGKLTHTSQFGDAYRFDLTQNPATGVYDVTIESPIDYRGQDASAHATHRLPGGANGMLRICFKAGKAPRDLRIAVAMALAWAERTSRYIRDGRSWS